MKLSDKKKDKISEQILSYLFSTNPKPQFTAHIANEIARDDDFTKSLLENLKRKGLVAEIKKNSFGKEYKQRTRWRLSDIAYKLYKEKQ